LHDWTKRKSFTKVEHACYRTPLGRKMKAPRLIQGASPYFIVLVGPWMMSFQTHVKRWWSLSGSICFTSGVSAGAAAEFVNRPGWTILEDDVGAWDASVDEIWLEFELWLFSFFGCPCAVVQLIKANINTHGVTSHGIKYKRRGMRKSGDPYTSVGNSIINGCIHLYIYCDATGYTVLIAKMTLRMLVQGDDNIMVYTCTVVIDWVFQMSEFGFNSEAIYRDDLTSAEFCSNLFYQTQAGWVLAPKPGKVISKLGYFISPPKHVSAKALVRGTALGLYVGCFHIPPLRAYLDRLLYLTDGVDPWFSPEFEHWKMRYSLNHCTPDTWLTLTRRYEWTHDCQRVFELNLVNSSLGSDHICPLFDLLCDRDTVGPNAVWMNPIN
jgi:hypothetical protein